MSNGKPRSVQMEEDIKTLSQQKNMALRFKSGVIQGAANVKSYVKGSKTSLVALNVDGANDDIPIVPSIDNLPPSITEVRFAFIYFTSLCVILKVSRCSHIVSRLLD